VNEKGYIFSLIEVHTISHQATKRLKRSQIQYPPIRKQDGSWDRSEEEKIETFATHLSKPNSYEITLEEKNKLLSDDTTSANLDILTKLLYYKRSDSQYKRSKSKESAGL